jgi:hypothetical protein
MSLWARNSFCPESRILGDWKANPFSGTSSEMEFAKVLWVGLFSCQWFSSIGFLVLFFMPA